MYIGGTYESVFTSSFGLIADDGFVRDLCYLLQKVQSREHCDGCIQRSHYCDGGDLQLCGEKVTLDVVAKPDKEMNKLMDPLQFGLEHEQYVTSLINDIYAAAYEVKDFRTMQFLDWFVKEQLEEEKNAEDMIKKMELFGNDSKGLYSLDTEYAARIYTAPSLVL